MTIASRNVPTSGRAVASTYPGAASPAELLRRSGRGDETAFAEFYDATSNRLFGLVLAVARDIALAEEVTQEVYLHVWRHSARFDPNHGSALSWIMKIAHQAAVERVNQAGPFTRPA
jgi:RNA polymerase sigma-70 factor (ECF subfamily)